VPAAAFSDVDDPLGKLLSVLRHGNAAEMIGSSIRGSCAAVRAALTCYAAPIICVDTGPLVSTIGQLWRGPVMLW